MWSPPDSVAAIDTRHGRILVPSGDKLIRRSLEVYGEWCEAEVQLCLKILRPGATVVDVGANVGTHAVPFARAVGPSGRVLTLDPQPFLAQLLGTTALLNGLPWLTPVLAGAGRAPGHIDMPEVDYREARNYGGVELGRLAASPRRLRVPVWPLDDLLGARDVALIKIDAERMEDQVLEGAAGLIARSQPAIYLENDWPDDLPAILEVLDRLGYRAHWHVVPLYSPQNWRGEGRNVFGELRAINLLAMPASRQVVGLKPVTGVEEHPRFGRQPNYPEHTGALGV